MIVTRPILLGTGANAYELARGFREFSDRLERPVAVGTAALLQCRESRYVGCAVLPSLADGETFGETMLRFSTRYPGERLLLIPCSDTMARLVARHRDELSGRYLIASPSLDALDAACDKTRFPDLCEKAGVRTPRTLTVRGGGSVGDADCEYPMMLKPASTPDWMRADPPGLAKDMIIHDRTELDESIKKAREYGYEGDYVLQPYIPGDVTRLRTVNAYRDSHGHVTMIGVGRVLVAETAPHRTGNYAAIVTTPRSTLHDMVVRLLDAADWHGYADIDVKIDARDDTPWVLELNPRLGGSSGYLHAGGLNAADAIRADLIDDTEPKQRRLEREALWMSAPWPVIRRRIPTPAARDHATRLKRRGAWSYSAWDERDMTFTRRVNLARCLIATARNL